MAPLTNVFLAATLSFANIVSLVSAAPQSSYVPLTSPNDQLYKRTLDPATSNTKGKCPGSTNCSAAKVSDAIQAAECSHNTRVSGTQTFAAFTTEHQYDSAHGAPYGSCAAYTCAAPTDAEMTDIDADCWTFFWDDNGEDSGVGTGCIEDPSTGECGCEDSDGTFVAGSSSCT